MTNEILSTLSVLLTDPVIICGLVWINGAVAGLVASNLMRGA